MEHTYSAAPVRGPSLSHAWSPSEVLSRTQSTEEGLTPDGAAQRLGAWGPNEIPTEPPPSVWGVVVRQFASPLIYVLGAAGVLSLYLGELPEAVFIAVVLLVNAVVGTVEEFRAERGIDALRSMIVTRVDVVRGGDLVEVDAREVVVGDVVLLASGARVPADIRLLSSRSLRADESPLTGESLPADKDPEAVVDPDAPLAEHRTMLHAGTLVVYGRGRGVVVATGARTRLGELAGELLEPATAEPPLLSRMRRFTLVVTAAIGVVAIVIGVAELSRGAAWHDVVLVAVALAVSAIPEGLPVAIVVALAVAVRRMGRRNVIVRHLVALESLGSCTAIASDKTGTLTMGELTVSRLVIPGESPWSVTGVGDVPEGSVRTEGDGSAAMVAVRGLARAGVLCNEGTLAREDGGWTHRGDAVDVALLVLGHKVGVTAADAPRLRPLLDAIPFESEHRYAATLHAVDPDTSEIVAKGAFERVLRMCTTEVTVEGPRPLDRAAMASAAEDLASQGFRVLAVAAGRRPRPTGDVLDHADLTGLGLLGLVGMSDPLRPRTKDAVDACRGAGIEVFVVTGDHPSTAASVASDLGIHGRVVTGEELRSATTAGSGSVDALTRGARVFARVEPAQKLDIVESLRREGHVVAVTGDGANDAPALHHAHVGVAMGRSGTDVAREAAELVVTDDDFASVVSGVHEGRVAYANIRKVIQLLVATGAAELVLLVSSVVVGLPIPLLAVQLLWLNVVTNGIQDVALAFEPAEGDEMRRRPRPPDEAIFNRLMVERVLLSAAVMSGLALTVYTWVLGQTDDVATARNYVVLLMVLLENVFVFCVRSERRSALNHDPRRNLPLVLGTVGAQAIHIAAMHLPLTQSVLGLAPIPLAHWAVLLALSLTLLAAVEGHKAWRRRTARTAAR